MKTLNVIHSGLTLAAASLVALSADQARRRSHSLELLDTGAAKALGVKVPKGATLARAKSALTFKVGEAVEYIAGPSANHRHIQTVTDADAKAAVFVSDLKAEIGRRLADEYAAGDKLADAEAARLKEQRQAKEKRERKAAREAEKVIADEKAAADEAAELERQALERAAAEEGAGGDDQAEIETVLAAGDDAGDAGTGEGAEPAGDETASGDELAAPGSAG